MLSRFFRRAVYRFATNWKPERMLLDLHLEIHMARPPLADKRTSLSHDGCPTQNGAGWMQRLAHLYPAMRRVDGVHDNVFANGWHLYIKRRGDSKMGSAELR